MGDGREKRGREERRKERKEGRGTDPIEYQHVKSIPPDGETRECGEFGLPS